MNQKIEIFWNEFLGIQPETFSQQKYSAWSFGNTPQMKNDLANLVLKGPKRGTTSLKWIYEEFPEEKFPQVGDFSVILDSAGEPKCIILTVKIEECKFKDVTEEFAFIEGEGDRSLKYWRDVHWRYFVSECESIGRVPSEDMPVVCEIFKVVYPASNGHSP